MNTVERKQDIFVKDIRAISPIGDIGIFVKYTKNDISQRQTL